MVGPTDVPHPGSRIRAEVLPPGMSVTKAAQLIGVGRPALSNLLNGKASLTAEMAARLETAFNHSRVDLMEMQVRYEAAQAKQKDAPIEARAYVAPFLAIKANDIEAWASHNILARSRLAVFLRMLVHSTGSGLTKVDFPGNDDSQRPGWDGFVEASRSSPWVPTGPSGWEFGTKEEPKSKADSDLKKSIEALGVERCGETTFLFVTPRRWAAKAAWVSDKQSKAIWKDVRAYDASDLEQWLEQSLPAQAWFANETHIPAQQVRSLDKCWADWANVSYPPISGALFVSAVEATKRKLLSLLSSPPERPIIVAADSTEEALAFLAQSLGQTGGESLAQYRDRVLVFDKPGVLPRLASSAQTFIPVACTREVERELAPYANTMHSIVVYPRNATVDPSITLEPANYDTFNKALEGMGKDRDEISRLANASGRSLTVLRRQLSTVPAIRTPVWAADLQTAASLVPFLLVGAWNSFNETDKLGLELLSNEHSYDELERICLRLAQLNDAPIWSVGKYRGVISKIDLLYAISGAITREDLNRYFSLARIVLGEDDPALDLEDDQRWAASIHGKKREFSSSFREGISETLVLLSVHGRDLFRDRIGIDTELEAVSVVRDLLVTPLTTRVLEANDRDLPLYAEAAPAEFLSILERDIKTSEPAVLGLLRPVDSSVFGLHPSRTGLLWALEGLCWNPITLPRAAFILSWLAQVEITDNWMNKPTNSLLSVFRAWMPQTAAPHEQRLSLIKRLAEKFPDVAWKICVAQFGNHFHVGNYSHKPRWRPDGYGFGEPFPTTTPVLAFMHEMVEMALTWRAHSLGMLCDLIERLEDLTDADQNRVWSLIEVWATNDATDVDKASMREKIRIAVTSPRMALKAQKKSARSALLTVACNAAYTALEPSDISNRVAWLFRDGWVREAADEIEDGASLDFQKREDRSRRLRIEALSEILVERGLVGLVELASRVSASSIIGTLAAEALLTDVQLQQLLLLALKPFLTSEESVHSYRNLIFGALRAVGDDRRVAVLAGLTPGLSEVDAARLFVLAPFEKSIWALVDALSEAAQTKYWTEVSPGHIFESDINVSDGIERLLKAGRPRAAFSRISYKPSKLEARLLCRLMLEMAQGGIDQPGHYMLEHYNVEEAFKYLDGSSALTPDEKAYLEFAYIEVLARPWDKQDKYGIPNLERYVEAHPELFVQAIAWTYKRKNGAIDPPEFQVSPERVATMAERGRKLVEGIQRIPGHNNLGELETNRLATWVSAVRKLCVELDRASAGDVCVGQVLSSARTGMDGVWPCEQVRQVAEDIQSEDMMRGMYTGVYNSRGVHSRGEGGGQDRELAEKYRKWAEALQVSHPFVSAKLLMELANTYDHQASQHDQEATIRLRLR